MKNRVLINIYVFFIKVYQKTIGKLIPNTCRFVPTCSNYTIQSIKKFGIIKGTSIALKRIVRCNPFSKSGYDPVPENIKGDYKWYL